MAEQFVGQEIMSSQNSELYCWDRQARNSTAEVDFLTVIGGDIVPIEVKSGAAGRLRSLHLLLESYPNFPYGIVFSSVPYSELPEKNLNFSLCITLTSSLKKIKSVRLNSGFLEMTQ